MDEIRQEWKDAEEYFDGENYVPVGDVDRMSYEEIKNKFYKDTVGVDAKIVKNSDDIFSLQVYGGVSCPHIAHVSDFNRSMTFDLRTGEEVPIEDLFVDYKKDMRKIIRIAYQDKPGFLKRVEANGCSAVEDFFDENGKEIDEDLYFDYTLSGKDIVFKQYVAHVIEVCSEFQSVPVSKLKAYIKPNGILGRMIQ